SASIWSMSATSLIFLRKSSRASSINDIRGMFLAVASFVSPSRCLFFRLFVDGNRCSPTGSTVFFSLLFSSSFLLIFYRHYAYGCVKYKKVKLYLLSKAKLASQNAEQRKS